jgi:hypothetical protein
MSFHEYLPGEACHHVRKRWIRPAFVGRGVHEFVTNPVSVSTTRQPEREADAFSRSGPRAPVVRVDVPYRPSVSPSPLTSPGSNK